MVFIAQDVRNERSLTATKPIFEGEGSIAGATASHFGVASADTCGSLDNGGASGVDDYSGNNDTAGNGNAANNATVNDSATHNTVANENAIHNTAANENATQNTAVNVNNDATHNTAANDNGTHNPAANNNTACDTVNDNTVSDNVANDNAATNNVANDNAAMNNVANDNAAKNNAAHSSSDARNHGDSHILHNMHHSDNTRNHENALYQMDRNNMDEDSSNLDEFGGSGNLSPLRLYDGVGSWMASQERRSALDRASPSTDMDTEDTAVSAVTSTRHSSEATESLSVVPKKRKASIITYGSRITRKSRLSMDPSDPVPVDPKPIPKPKPAQKAKPTANTQAATKQKPGVGKALGRANTLNGDTQSPQAVATPVWFSKAFNWFRSLSDGAAWQKLISSWMEFEKRENYGSSVSISHFH